MDAAGLATLAVSVAADGAAAAPPSPRDHDVVLAVPAGPCCFQGAALPDPGYTSTANDNRTLIRHW